MASYNELFGLGTHSEDANIVSRLLMQDDAANTAVDDLSSNANDGTLSGGDNTSDISTTGPTSYLAKALDLDGSSDYVDMPGENPNGEFTVMSWVDFTASGDVWYYNAVTTTDHLIVGTNFTSPSDTILVQHANGSGVRSNSVLSYPTGWMHLAVTKTGTQSATKIYIDGADETDDTNVSTWWVYNAQTENIGRRDPTGNPARPLDGPIAGFATFDRALTAAEIAEHKNGPEPINTVAPTAPTGTKTEDETLTAVTGSWDSQSNGTITYTYQWIRANDGSGTGAADIAGATSATYVLQSADATKYIACRIAASNDGGNDSAQDQTSSYTTVISASGGGGGGLPIPVAAYHYRQMQRN